MRFEELYTSEIIGQLTTALTTSVGTSPNIVYYLPKINSNMEHLVKPLNDDVNTYGICVRNTGLVRSNLADIDFNTISFVVEAVMKENNLQTFLDATEDVAKLYDSALDSITDGSTTIQYKPAFNVAYLSAPRYSISCGMQSVNVVNVSWIINVQYTTSSILVAKDVFKLTINSTDTELTNVLEYSISGNVNCNPVQLLGQTKLDYKRVNYTTTIVLTIRATNSTTGINKTLDDACINPSSLSGLSAFKYNGTSYNVQSFNATKIWRDNTAVYQLTLNY